MSEITAVRHEPCPTLSADRHVHKRTYHQPITSTNRYSHHHRNWPPLVINYRHFPHRCSLPLHTILHSWASNPTGETIRGALVALEQPAPYTVAPHTPVERDPVHLASAYAYAEISIKSAHPGTANPVSVPKNYHALLFRSRSTNLTCLVASA
jgi:hypothetical protein